VQPSPGGPDVLSTVPSFHQVRISERIADYFRQQIVRGRLVQGDKLPSEAEAMNAFGVSRAVLREALRILEAEDLVSVQQGARGAVVRAPSPEVAARYVGFLLQSAGTTRSELFHARGLVQPTAVGLFATHQPAEGLLRLEEALESEVASLEDRFGFIGQSLAFQRLLTDYCGDPVIQVFGAILDSLSHRFLRSAMAAPDYPDHLHLWLHDKHRQLVKLIKSGNVAKAEMFWRSVITEQTEQVLSTMDDASYDVWEAG
jgi:GntR family transcriptional regulator, transcriptional repressor for pyruvate dehydrogenase complex